MGGTGRSEASAEFWVPGSELEAGEKSGTDGTINAQAQSGEIDPDLPALRPCSIERVVLVSIDGSHKKGTSIKSH
jgi:hypothetical protein